MVRPIIWDLVLKSLIENVSRYLQSNSATPKFSFLLKFSSVVSGVFLQFQSNFLKRLQGASDISNQVHRITLFVFVLREYHCENNFKLPL